MITKINTKNKFEAGDPVLFSSNGKEPQTSIGNDSLKALLSKANELPEDPDESKTASFDIANRAGHLKAIDWFTLRDAIRAACKATKADLEQIYKEAHISFLKRSRAEQLAHSPEESEEKRAARINKVYEQAKPLLNDPNLLDIIGNEIQRSGYAGDLRPPKIIYLALTSRNLERPQNVQIIGPSAIGKTHTMDRVVVLFPASAYYLLKAGSSRALIYNEEQFEHRVVIVSEADSIPEEGPAAAAVRALASDNQMEYEVVERHEETGHFATRHIVKPGPTGLLTTSTKRLGPQMSTRVLELTLADDQDQTKAVVQAHAAQVIPNSAPVPDVSRFIAVQQWLDLAGERRVIVPFAGKLAEELPEQALKILRMRRDFRQLLTCIQTVAFLYQQQRSRTDAGEVVATIEDYAMARDLLAPLFATIISDGVTDTVRDTVNAVNEGEEVNQAELCRRLGLSKSTVYWRVRQALSGGWLINKEERRGRPAKLCLGTPLPEKVPPLPSPEHLKERFEGSNDIRKEHTPVLHTPLEEEHLDSAYIYPSETDSNPRIPEAPPPVESVSNADSNPREGKNDSNPHSNPRTVNETHE